MFCKCLKLELQAIFDSGIILPLEFSWKRLVFFSDPLWLLAFMFLVSLGDDGVLLQQSALC